MYKVYKDKGIYANIIVENTDTMASVVIGTYNMTIGKILGDGGYEIPSVSDEWNIKIDTETAGKLVETAISMKKPIRDQRKIKSEQDTNQQKPDALDVLLGIASYVKKGDE